MKLCSKNSYAKGSAWPEAAANGRMRAGTGGPNTKNVKQIRKEQTAEEWIFLRCCIMPCGTAGARLPKRIDEREPQCYDKTVIL